VKTSIIFLLYSILIRGPFVLVFISMCEAAVKFSTEDPTIPLVMLDYASRSNTSTWLSSVLLIKYI
jgi:hypothetical protein